MKTFFRYIVSKLEKYTPACLIVCLLLFVYGIFTTISLVGRANAVMPETAEIELRMKVVEEELVGCRQELYVSLFK